MDTYYEEILKEIEKLYQKKDFQEIYTILKDELSMPYIPKEYEDKMVSLFNECRCELELNKVQRNYQEEDIDHLLSGSLDEQFMSIDLIKKSNIRNHLDVIEAYLKTECHSLVRAYLIEALMEQNVTSELALNYEGMDVTFTPCYVENPMDCDGVQIAVQYLREWFENDNPSYLMMCMETLVKEAYLRLPFSIDEDEGELLAYAVAQYVLEANKDDSSYELLKHKKELARTGSFELLLNKHDI